MALQLPAPVAADCGISVDRLKRMSECELEQLFAELPAGNCPLGYYRGRVVCLTGTCLPRLKASLGNALWRGKHFHDDGTLINQFLFCRALWSRTCLGTSWYDGQPCIVVEYTANTPLFGNTRDEFRAICPGLYLGRFYDRCPCPKFRGFFILQCRCWSSCS